MSLCDKHIPKILVKDSFQPPWFDAEVFRLSKKKEHARKLHKVSKNYDHYRKYSTLRKELKLLIKSKMKSNFDDDLSPKIISKKFWSYVKSCTKSNRLPHKMYLKDSTRNTRDGIANLFNKHFQNQFSDSSRYDIDIDFANDQSNDLTITSDTIFQLLRKLNPNKSQGPDKISGHLLKGCAPSIAFPLKTLFNLSYRTGSLPEEWKLANIVPVHKKDDKNNIENYRPISLTSIVSKLFEKCIRDELLFRCQHLLYDNQHGFLPNKSCTTQLVPFSHDISLALNANELIDVVYFDFAKAFDSVNHDCILEKLKYKFNIDGLMLKFIKEYLKDRKQRVVVDNEISYTLDVKSGVPQGSILGPLLFVIFINDIQTVVSPGTKIALYADDTKIWRQMQSKYDYDILQSDINSLYEWSVRNKMRFHPDKCKILSIHHFHKNVFQELPFFLYPYEMNNIILDYCNTEKDLGILINNKFNFKDHRNLILSKAINQFNLLRRTCHFVKNPSKRRTLYLTMIRSLFEHGSQIWSPASENIDTFESFQKRCVKWILLEQYKSYTELDYFSKLTALKILPLYYKFIYSDIVFFHKIVSNSIPLSLPKEVTNLTCRTRSSSSITNGFQIHKNTTINKKVFYNSFYVRTIPQWNRLPNEIKDIGDTNNFSKALIDFFWSEIQVKIANLSSNLLTSIREPD